MIPTGQYLLFVRFHLTIKCQISTDIYVLKLGTKFEIELSDGIWWTSDFYLTSRRYCLILKIIWFHRDKIELKYILFSSNIKQLSTIEFIGVILFNDKYSKVSFLRKTPLINFICNYLIGDFHLHCLHYCFDNCIWLAKIQEVA